MKYLLSLVFCLFCLINPAVANFSIVDALDISGFIPLVLDVLMTVAQGTYDFFIGNGDGVIYILIWAILASTIILYLVKMYFPSNWLSLFGFSGGGEMWANKISAWKIGENIIKPAFRAMVAVVILLPIKPIYVTDWLLDPFLRFGYIYSSEILNNISIVNPNENLGCDKVNFTKNWITRESCNFLVKPVEKIAYENSKIIKKGFEFVVSGLSGLMMLIPHGGEDFLNLITGILLIFTFVSSNFFMGLLIIQGIFKLGSALILYPFNVLLWVIKPNNPDRWIDLLPPFENLIKSLQTLVITMITSSFILVLNVAIVKALFSWNSSVFNVTTGVNVETNLPGSDISFGEHSIIWLSSILTFYLMYSLFDKTKELLLRYSKERNDLFDSVKSDSKSLYNIVKSKINLVRGALKK